MGPLPIASVDELGGCVAVCLEGAQDAVVDLPEKDLARVGARRVVARQWDATDHTGLE